MKCFPADNNGKEKKSRCIPQIFFFTHILYLCPLHLAKSVFCCETQECSVEEQSYEISFWPFERGVGKQSVF